MNKVLYVGRKAKGLSEKQIAKVLQIEEQEYIELEHSLKDVSAQLALKLAKLFDIDAEIFIYTDGHDVRLLKYATDEISGYMQGGMLNNLPQQYLGQIMALGNTALRLAADLNHAVYKQYELEQDNQALRKLNAALKETPQR
jgi:transcriptional regulator with XRE-family HTH domain